MGFIHASSAVGSILETTVLCIIMYSIYATVVQVQMCIAISGAVEVRIEAMLSVVIL